MRTIAAGKAKAQFLGLLDEVRNKRESVIVTKHGKLWAKIVPLDMEVGEDPLEVFRFPGKIEIHGDIVVRLIRTRNWTGSSGRLWSRSFDCGGHPCGDLADSGTDSNFCRSDSCFDGGPQFRRSGDRGYHLAGDCVARLHRSHFGSSATGGVSGFCGVVVSGDSDQRPDRRTFHAIYRCVSKGSGGQADWGDCGRAWGTAGDEG
jgi:prevent-host-death family protein